MRKGNKICISMYAGISVIKLCVCCQVTAAARSISSSEAPDPRIQPPDKHSRARRYGCWTNACAMGMEGVGLYLVSVRRPLPCSPFHSFIPPPPSPPAFFLHLPAFDSSPSKPAINYNCLMTAGWLVLGQAGNLGIILRSYEPVYIECGSTMQRYTPGDHCAELLAAIPAEVAPAISWGPGGRGLPYFWQLQGWLSFLSFFPFLSLSTRSTGLCWLMVLILRGVG